MDNTQEQIATNAADERELDSAELMAAVGGSDTLGGLLGVVLKDDGDVVDNKDGRIVSPEEGINVLSSR